MHAQVERPGLVGIEERESVVGDDVGQVALGPDDLAVADHVHVVVSPAAVRVAEPMRHAVLRGHVAAEVPFAAEPARIAVRGEYVRVSGQSLKIIRRPGRRGLVSDPVVDAVLGRDSAARDACPRGRADGRGAEEVFEPRAAAGETVKIRRADLVVARASERPRPLVVAQDKKHVRLLRLAQHIAPYMRTSISILPYEEPFGHSTGRPVPSHAFSSPIPPPRKSEKVGRKWYSKSKTTDIHM